MNTLFLTSVLSGGLEIYSDTRVVAAIGLQPSGDSHFIGAKGLR